jgi:putative restriction endonuclease
MNIHTFYTEMLGANLRNVRWSWGAVDPITDRVFLRVWKDQIEPMNGRERVVVALDQPRRRSNGFPERNAHLDQIVGGAEGFGVVCTAVDPYTTEARAIATFDPTYLLRLGTLVNENGRTYAYIDGRVPVAEVMRQRTGQTTLTEDLRLLVKQKIDATTKEALINARVGQGAFRAKVLRLWESRCSVSGSATLDAIRASHIKPWRSCTNDERLDPANGLPLVATLDALFDAGLISFDLESRLIVSPLMNVTEQELFGLANRSLRMTPPAQTAAYLEYHRAHVFRQ